MLVIVIVGEDADSPAAADYVVVGVFHVFACWFSSLAAAGGCAGVKAGSGQQSSTPFFRIISWKDDNGPSGARSVVVVLVFAFVTVLNVELPLRRGLVEMLPTPSPALPTNT